MKSQWWSKDKLIEYQNDRLRRLINYAYKNVEYYNELFKDNNLVPNDIQSRDDLYKIPILTKDIIRENYSKLKNQSYNQKKIIKHKSSGSTGEPIQYDVTKDAYSFNIACNLRGWYWMGYRLGDKFIKISQYERSKGKQFQDLILRTKYISSRVLNDEQFEKILQIFRSYKPNVIRSYPDPLFFIAKYMEKNGIFDIQPNVLTTTGNLLLPNVRNYIEKQFRCKIFDSYRCEGGPNAFESINHDCYLLSMEYGISEIIANNIEVGPGEEGKHITTDLHNYAMPFIRYDSQDIVVKGSHSCSSGRQHQTIDKVYGRDSDILITPSNKYLIVLHFADYFDQFKEIKQFQIKQVRIDFIKIILVVSKDFMEKQKEIIMNYWKEYIGSDVELKMEIVDEIQLSKSGKRRFLIRDKSIRLPI